MRVGLFPGGSTYAQSGDGPVPVAQVGVQLVKSVAASAIDGVVFDIGARVFRQYHLPGVLGPPRASGLFTQETTRR